MNSLSMNNKDISESWNQDGSSFLFPLLPDHVKQLDTLLLQHNESIPPDPNSCLQQVSSLHFLRLVIINAQTAENPLWKLTLSTNYDGNLKHHLKELSEKANTFFSSIFEHCTAFDNNVLAFLEKHFVNYSALYCGTRGRSSSQIQKEAKLRNAIIDFLHNPQRQWNNQSSLDIFHKVKDFVKKSEQFQWALEDPQNHLPTPTFWGRLFLSLEQQKSSANKLTNALLFLLALPILLLLSIPLFVLWLILRYHEEKDSTGNYRDRSTANEFQYKTIHLVQNQLSNIVEIKPGFFRLYTLKFVLTAIHFLAKYKFVQGFLGGIPSIHFARWIIIDNKKLLFFSNFDGSWENYLGDFVDKAAMGLTGVWSNTKFFPYTRNLIGQKQTGANDEEIFKLWARSIQIPTQFWFSAYPTLSTLNINNNSKIREGLLKDLTETQAKDWLRRMI